MFKILKNLKQSWMSVLVIVALLCVQAAVDLELPNYTSKIVNTGIQAGGIEYAVPETISQKDMDAILLFSNDDDKILENYTTEDTDGNYVIKDLKESEKEDLEQIMTKPIIISRTVQKEEMANKIKEQILANVPDGQKEILQNMSIIDILKTMPKEQLNQMLGESTKQIDEMQDSIKSQAVVAYVKEIYKDAGVDTDKLQINYIIIAGLKMLALAAISMASGITIMMLSSRVGAKMAKTLREKIFNKVLKFSTKELREFSTASLITRSTNDVQQIQQLLAMLFRTVVYAPIIGIGGVIKVIHQSNTSMAWIIGAAVITILVIVAILFAVAMPKFKKLQDLIDKLNGVAREILTGKSVIRAFNTEEREETRYLINFLTSIL